MARLVTVIDTFCQLSEGLKRLREVCEAMPTQHAWGKRSSSGTTTWPEDDNKLEKTDTGECCPTKQKKMIKNYSYLVKTMRLKQNKTPERQQVNAADNFCFFTETLSYSINKQISGI